MSVNIKQHVINIDKHVKEILLDGGDEKLLVSLHDIMGDLKEIMESTSDNEKDAYFQEYDGFYHVMKLLESLAISISDGSISACE